jgi:hypothetical protein
MRLHILPLIMLLAASASAQQQQMKTRLMTLSLDRHVESLYFLNGGKAQPFTAERSGLGEPFAYTGTPRFILRAKPEDFSSPPPLPPPVASVDLPQQARMVMLVAGTGSGGKLKLAAYDISPGRFQAGDYRVFNFSTKNLAMMIGQNRFALRPGQDTIVSNSMLRDRVLDVFVRIAEERDGGMKKVYSSAWGHKPSKHHYVFLFNGSEDASPVEIRRYSTYPE